MTILENVLNALGLLPINGLGESMKESKTLTIMVLVMVAAFCAFAAFLIHMAGEQP